MTARTANNHFNFNALDSALIVAAILHAFFILSVSFQSEDRSPKPVQSRLDVILVDNSKSAEKNKEADYLAQSNQEGGAQDQGQSRPAAPPQASLLETQPTPAPRLERSGEVEPAPPSSKPVLSSKAPNEQKTAPKTSKSAVEAPPRAPIAQLLASTEQEISRLTAEIDRNQSYASSRLKRKAINASTQEYKYAAYLAAWRDKVERIGNLNYPDEARRMKLYGELLLHVAIRADGSVQKIRVLRSSGQQLLDDAAVRIVQLAAPFAPFPPEISQEADVIDITRTWQFLSNNQLFTGK